MNRRDAETQRVNEITERIIGCTCHEITQASLRVQPQVPLPVTYKQVVLDCGYRMDAVVESAVIVEFKTVEKLLPVHEAQLLSYLKLMGLKVGLLINFHVPVLKDGLKRLMN